LLTTHSFDQSRGVYVPFSETVFLLGKLQKPLVRIEPLTAPINQHFPYTYFTNPLLLPIDYDASGFEVEQAPASKDAHERRFHRHHVLAGNGLGSAYVNVNLLCKLFGSK
jgi:hypothetical protein